MSRKIYATIIDNDIVELKLDDYLYILDKLQDKCNQIEGIRELIKKKEIK